MQKPKIKWNNLVVPLSIYLAVLLITIIITQEWLFSISPIKKLELKFIDDRFNQRGSLNIADSSKVIILEINQESLDQIPPPNNHFPFPRSIYAKVIENLTEAGVKAIGIDIIMPDSDKFSTENDTALTNAIRKSGKVVVAGKIDDYKELQIESGGIRNSSKYIGENFGNIFFDADSSIGIVMPPSDMDQVYRRYYPYIATNFRLEDGSLISIKLPSFGYALLNKYYGISKYKVASKKQNGFFLYDKMIPSFDNYSVLINFYGPSGSFKRIPIADVLDDKDFNTIDELDGKEINFWDCEDGLLSSGIFKDKIVLIGSTNPEDRDLFNVSYSKGEKTSDNQMYGVEYHANAIQNVISNDFIKKQSILDEVYFIILFTGFVFGTTTLIRKVKYRYGAFIEIANLVVVFLLIYCVYQISIYYFINYKILTAVVSPSLGIVLGYFGSTAYHLLNERKQNVFIKGIFSQYVNKNVVQELLTNPDKLKLGGEKKKVTVLFSDMVGFTTFSESKTPEELVKFINGFLHEMTELIMQNTGTLDKYLGDSVMAFWGAPLEIKNHAYLACKTAIEMQKKVEQISCEWVEKGEKQLNIRIGLNSGEVIVGNVGGAKHKNYTVMGDNVNLASRLEGANKEYNSEIMISEATYEEAKEYLLVRELDSIKVKGKSKPTKVYELIGMAGDSDAEAKLNQLLDYNSALKLYNQRKFSDASVLFGKCYKEFNDYPSKVYLDRCETYIVSPPEENWDGVFILKNK